MAERLSQVALNLIRVEKPDPVTVAAGDTNICVRPLSEFYRHRQNPAIGK
jgi:hypothetical protein